MFWQFKNDPKGDICKTVLTKAGVDYRNTGFMDGSSTQPSNNSQPSDNTKPSNNTQPSDNTKPSNNTQPSNNTKPSNNTQP